MLRIFLLIYIITSVLVHFNDGQMNIRVRITNYANHHNLMHNGAKCETHYWLGDHCDPMFDICISSGIWNSCNIKSKFINFVANKKYIYFIWEETIQYYSLFDFINIRVTVTDHDRFDAHDHIAYFNGVFHVPGHGLNYRKRMEVIPRGLDVHLDAEVMVSCMANYYGPKCAKRCVSQKFVYDCDQSTGEKICTHDCGFHGKCMLYSYYNRIIVKCKCSKGWVGTKCETEVIDPTTTELPVPSTSIVFSTTELKETTLASTVSPSTTTKPTTYIESYNKTPTMESFKIPITSEYTENTRQLSPHNINSINSNDKVTVVASNARLEQKEYSNKDRLPNHSNITISQILIMISVAIAICLMLVFGHQYLKLKYKYKYLNQSLVQRSLPPVVFKSNQNNQDCTLYTMADSEYDTCSIKTNFNDQPEVAKFQNNAIEDDYNFYETPISKNRQI